MKKKQRKKVYDRKPGIRYFCACCGGMLYRGIPEKNVRRKAMGKSSYCRDKECLMYGVDQSKHGGYPENELNAFRAHFLEDMEPAYTPSEIVLGSGFEPFSGEPGPVQEARVEIRKAAAENPDGFRPIALTISILLQEMGRISFANKLIEIFDLSELKRPK